MSVMENVTLAPTKVLSMPKADEYPDRLSGGQQ